MYADKVECIRKKPVLKIKTAKIMMNKFVLVNSKKPTPKVKIPKMVLFISLPSLAHILYALSETSTPIKYII
jgi:hypothetical protein